MIVTATLTASSIAPIDQRLQTGYFNDDATCSLLSLNYSDQLLHSGTYCNKELCTHFIAFPSLQTPGLDQQLQPISPLNHALTSSAIGMHEHNGKLPALVQMPENKASISLHNYIRVLEPQLNYSENSDSRPFSYPFQVFLAPSATWTRRAHISRVTATLEAMTNCMPAMAHGPSNWPKEEATGMVASNDEVLRLLATFRMPGIHISALGKTVLSTTGCIPNFPSDFNHLNTEGLKADGLAKYKDKQDKSAPYYPHYMPAKVEASAVLLKLLFLASSEEPVSRRSGMLQATTLPSITEVQQPMPDLHRTASSLATSTSSPPSLFSSSPLVSVSFTVLLARSQSPFQQLLQAHIMEETHPKNCLHQNHSNM